VDATEPVADETPNVDGSRSPEPLLIFASHQSHHRALVGQVADELKWFGVTLFVAHVSIEPDRLWREEILRTLDRADAGVSFLHKEFKASDWCDQETGWLLGRRVPVISLKFDLTPYGPLGERQAINAVGLPPKAIATSVLDVLEARTELHPTLASSLVEAMNASRSFNTTDHVWERLRKLRNLDTAQCGHLLDAVENNSQVLWAGSPHDGGNPYTEVVHAFVAEQPGAVDNVLERLAQPTGS